MRDALLLCFGLLLLLSGAEALTDGPRGGRRARAGGRGQVDGRWLVWAVGPRFT